MRRIFAIAIMVGTAMAATPFASANERPIKQLPEDVARWSTMWVAIPEQMLEVGQDYGPLAAVTWGPAKGTGKMLYSTGKELWDAAKPDKRPGHRRGDRGVKGFIFRYEF